MVAMLNAFVFACSSDKDGALTTDAAADAPSDSKPSGRDAGADEPAPVCEPQAVAERSRYIPPRPWHQPACTPSQVTGYLASCLRVETAVCEAFAKQNPTCFACAQTRETEPAWGAFVFFDGGYFNPNYNGCVANALGDISPEGCGAAGARLSDCASAACRGCLPVTTQDEYDRFDKCSNRKEVAKICADDFAAFNVKCADHREPTPDDPTYPCYGFGVSDEEFYRYYVTAFCTPEMDGGLDASDASLE